MRDDCERMEPLLSAYVDGELSGAKLEEVKGHLAGCAHCREVLEQFRTVDGLYASGPVGTDLSEPTEGRWKRMLWNVLPRSEVGADKSRDAYLTAGPRRIPIAISSRRLVRWAGPAAAALALAGMVLVVVILVTGPGDKLLILADDNTCRLIELGSTAAGFEVMLHLPTDAGDLLVVDITRAEDDRPGSI